MVRRIGRSVVAFLLARAARRVVGRYQPRVVMVTGSVGKTSVKDAAALVLAQRFLVRKSEQSANTEFGVPCTILGVSHPWGSVLGWGRVLLRALALIMLPNHYPNLLLLEVGADAPGDLARILRIARPDAVIVTRLPEIPVHVEFYDSPGAVREEEFVPAEALASGAPLVVPADDPYALTLAAHTRAQVATYGEEGSATVRVTDAGPWVEGGSVRGVRGTLTGGGQSQEVRLAGAAGRTQVLAFAAAVALGLAFDIPLTESTAALAGYEVPAGRGRLIAGLHGSLLIDDSYNASPAAVEEALKTLAWVPAAGRRIAVLGDMLELGRYSVMEHERIGAQAAAAADMLVAVGIRARGFAEAARAAGMSETRVMAFDDAQAAAAALPAIIGPGDVVLIKASQAVRAECITAALLANPADSALLPRQSAAWRARP